MQQRSIRKNTIYSILKTSSTILFPLITFPYISRVLLAENIGRIHFGLSVVSYFSLIATLGITTYAIRECSRVRNNKDNLSSTASQLFSISAITTVIAYLILALILILCRKLDSYCSLIMIQSLTIMATTLGADWLNSAMEDFKYITIRTIVFQLVSLILMFLFVRQPEDYMKYAAISLVSSGGASISNIWYRKRYCKVSFTIAIDWRKHFTPILFLFVMVLSQNIFNNVDSTMLGLMHGDREVGIYSAAHKISNLISQVVTSLIWVVMPRMSYYFSEENYIEINRLMRKVLGFHTILGLPCAVGTVMLSNEIIEIVAGRDFAEAALVLRILMLGFVFTLFGGSFLGNIVLLPSKREKEYMIICCITAAVNIVMNYMLIPLWGARAAAATTSFCALLIFVLLLFTVDKRIKIPNVKNLILTPVAGCVGIVLACLGCSPIKDLWTRSITSVALSVFLYGVVLLLGKNELLISILKGLKIFPSR